MTIILGLNLFHADSSACIFKDGVMLAAVEEERFRRIKHWSGFPQLSIEYCLREAGIPMSAVDHIAINQDSKANLSKKALYTFLKRPNLALVRDRLKIKNDRVNIDLILAKTWPNDLFKGEIHHIEHHIAHLSSTFYVSPFEEAIVLSVDGFGDFASTAWGVGSGKNLNVKDRIFFPHSLGIFYQALTQFIGFWSYGDEYKVMGLAPYGSPKYLPEMRQIVHLLDDGTFKLNLSYFRHQNDKIEFGDKEGLPKVGQLFAREIEKLLGPARLNSEELLQKHMDIAHSVQAMYEEAFFHLLNNLHKKFPIDNLALAGGCGMNSVANGKIRLKTPFKNVYVQSAAGDAGGAIGAAIDLWYRLNIRKENKRVEVHNHAYWGPSFSDDEIKSIIDKNFLKLNIEECEVNIASNKESLYSEVAEEVAKGSVVGWFQGRMEWGPRALGNRSIVCDPRRSNMKDILNIKIKRRESFRPFAPSVLAEAVDEWFEQNDDVPFMMQVYQIHPELRNRIPAVVHIDGSGRLQSVHQTTNPMYYGLIKAFEKITGVPMVLNTSFNENEPIVCTPEEALNCFLRTKMDVLVMGMWIIKRR